MDSLERQETSEKTETENGSCRCVSNLSYVGHFVTTAGCQVRFLGAPTASIGSGGGGGS